MGNDEQYRNSQRARDRRVENIILAVLVAATLFTFALQRCYSPGGSEVLAAQSDPRTKDPHECKKVCFPPGYDGEWPEEFPDDVRKVMCEGTYCAKAGHGHEPDEEDEKCKAHFTCTVHCSEICCVCLRECV